MDKFALEACCLDRLLPDEIPVPVDTHHGRLHVRTERHHPRPPADIVSDQTDPSINVAPAASRRATRDRRWRVPEMYSPGGKYMAPPDFPAASMAAWIARVSLVLP